MKKNFVIVLISVLVLISFCACGNRFKEAYNNYSSDSGSQESLLIDSISYNMGAFVFNTQYVYRIADIQFDGDFSDESKENFRSYKYFLSSHLYKEGDEVPMDSYLAGTIYITAGEKLFDLRPKAIEKQDTYLIYGYRHTLKSGIEFISSTENLYNEIWECSKDLIKIEYIYSDFTM